MRKLVAVVSIVLLTGCASPMPPYQASATPEQIDAAWQVCRQENLQAYMSSRPVAGLGAIGAAINSSVVDWDHCAMIDRCMASRGFSLPVDWTPPAGGRC
jgi:hypothetical protein